MTETIIAHKDLFLYTLLGFLVFGWALNALVAWIFKWLTGKIDKAYEQGDAADDKLLTAFLKFTLAFFEWVNEKYGEDWPAKLEAKLNGYFSMIPIIPLKLLLSANVGKIIDLAKKIYTLGKQLAEKEVQEHNEPPQPPVA